MVRPSDSLGPRRNDRETVTCTPQEEDAERPLTSNWRRLVASAYPPKSDENLSPRANHPQTPSLPSHQGISDFCCLHPGELWQVTTSLPGIVRRPFGLRYVVRQVWNRFFFKCWEVWLQPRTPHEDTQHRRPINGRERAQMRGRASTGGQKSQNRWFVNKQHCLGLLKDFRAYELPSPEHQFKACHWPRVKLQT